VGVRCNEGKIIVNINTKIQAKYCVRVSKNVKQENVLKFVKEIVRSVVCLCRHGIEL